MKIGIIVHSKSGHTFNVARKIASKCNEKNFETEIIKLKPEGKIVPRSKEISIVDPPKIDSFDVIIFGGPVWAFTASPVIVSYLKSISNCQGKKLLNFVTMGFPFAFLGGKQAVALMDKLLSKTGGTLLPGEIVAKSSGINAAKLDQIIDRIVQKIS